MDQTEKLSISLPASLARLVRQKVKAGTYASNSEVIRDALRAWQEREMEREQVLASARARIAEALDDDRPPVPARTVSARLQRLHRDTVKARRRAG